MAAKIQLIDVDREAEKIRLSTLIADMTSRLDSAFQRVFSQVGVLESKIADGPRGGGAFDRSLAPNSRAPRIRVPDPSGWKLKEMAGKEDAWSTWREAFELQVGSIWPGLDRMLMKIRDIAYDSPVEKVHYDRENGTMGLNDPSLGMNPADWSHQFVSQKLFMVIFSHLGVDAKKIIQSELNGNRTGSRHIACSIENTIPRAMISSRLSSRR